MTTINEYEIWLKRKVRKIDSVIFRNQYVSLLYIAKIHGKLAVEVYIIVNKQRTKYLPAKGVLAGPPGAC